jgi:hypothetical protein
MSLIASFYVPENARSAISRALIFPSGRTLADPGRFGRTLWYARLGHDPNWFKQHLDIEAEASVIKVFEALVIPGLLQLPEYTRELVVAGRPPNVEELVEERMGRQAILTRDPPPVLLVLLTENVLDWPIGDADLMRSQLAYLLELSERPNIGIRVVPRSAKATASRSP